MGVLSSHLQMDKEERKEFKAFLAALKPIEKLVKILF